MQDMLDDATSPRPHVTWALVLLIVWCAVEAAIFTVTMRPTMSELLAFLTIIIAGSFACIHVLNEAIAARQIGNIVQMALVQIAVAMFQVLFLYRELVDQITPWLAQGGITLSVGSTLGLGFFAWVGVRGMTWYLFGRTGAPALIAMLNRPAGRSANQI